MNQCNRVSPAMHFVRSTAVAAAMLAAVSTASVARAESVSLNPDGTGAAGLPATGNAAPIDGHGSGFVIVQPDPTSATQARFFETGAYELTQPDGVSRLGTHDVTLTYSVFGSIDLLSGQLSFSSGIVNIYSDSQFNFGSISPASPIIYGANDGAPIASFSISAGGGLASGAVSLQADAIVGTILPGYFYTASGIDVIATQQLHLTVQIGNSIDMAPSNAVVAEIVCKAAAFPGPGCAGGSYANTPYYFVVSDHAQATLSAVPEPSSGATALAGIALIGAIARSKRLARNAQSSAPVDA